MSAVKLSNISLKSFYKLIKFFFLVHNKTLTQVWLQRQLNTTQEDAEKNKTTESSNN